MSRPVAVPSVGIPTDGPQEATVDTRDLIRATTAAWNSRDRNGYLMLYTEDCAVQAPGFDGHGREELGTYWDSFMAAFPDNRISVLRVAGGAGDELAVEESVLEGTHTGPLAGADGAVLPASGRPVSLPFCMVHEPRHGLLAASRLYVDQLELLTQIGVPAEAVLP
jgi:ketosteroid isomerase-like protein